MLRMSRELFEQVVADALDGLPDDLGAAFENVAVTVEDEPELELLEAMGMDPEEDTLFGIYQGTSLPERALDGYGGTWRTHRYPGVRSDSDLYTFGYRFKPWTGTPIASGEEIQRYLGEVIAGHAEIRRRLTRESNKNGDLGVWFEVPEDGVHVVLDVLRNTVKEVGHAAALALVKCRSRIMRAPCWIAAI